MTFGGRGVTPSLLSSSEFGFSCIVTGQVARRGELIASPSL
jgi:hypothetical protein